MSTIDIAVTRQEGLPMSAVRLGPPKDRTGMMLGLLAFAQLIISVDYNIVYVALPRIGEALHFTDQTLQWVVSAYALAFGGLLLLGGRACDLLGARRVYLAGLALYAVGSALGGLSTGAVTILLARAVQGLGGALLFPSVLTLLSTRFPDPHQRHRAFALWGTAGGAGMILGSLLGGMLTQAFGWQSVFWVNVPLAVGTIALSLLAISPDAAVTRGRSYDVTGAVTATAGIALVIFALVQAPEDGWTAATTRTGLALGAALLAVFAIVERGSGDPLLPGRLLGHRNLRAGMAVTAIYMASFGTLLYFLTVFFQVVQGRSALVTGLAFLAPMVGIALGAQLGGRVVTVHGPRRVMAVSALVGAFGAGLLSLQLEPGRSYLALVPALVVLGLGQGSGWTVMFAGATQGVDPYDQGIASGMASTTQQIGGATGLAVLVGLSNFVTGNGRGSVADVTTQGLRAALLLATVGMVVTAAAALRFEAPAAAEEIPHEAAPVAL